jgi:hypothetical protein
MRKTIAALLFVAGAFNLYSVIGVFGPDYLSTLYGVRIKDSNLLILMRHRALLFGLLGGLLIIAAFRPSLQLAAIGAGLASMLGIIALALNSGDYNPLLHRIVVVDSILSLGLLLAFALCVLQPASHKLPNQ